MEIKGVEMMDTLINGKWHIILPKHRHDRPEWYTEKGWERARLDSIHKNITNEDTMFYVGAEEGDMPALIQMWGAKMVLFEPNPKVWPNIKAIWDANHLTHPWCFNGFAANKTTGGAEFKNDFPDSASGEIIGNHGFKELAYESNYYPCAKIDSIVNVSGLIPSAISCDVEGAEFEVLKGAEQTILKYHPKLWMSIHPEFAFRMFGVYQYDIRNWIIDRGYKEQILDYQHELHTFYEPK
jgi:FkbM family methyltransferase